MRIRHSRNSCSQAAVPKPVWAVILYNNTLYILAVSASQRCRRTKAPAYTFRARNVYLYEQTSIP
ncbi:hypothetical protein C8E01_12078 [Pontibacter virosus]|uniref:Uncharacterized protein n=1 Tax=Pontibacter virosus TaxID=1765052 RepID=A0A2U1ANL2_9BACT|nr:hypothetical protein C8E01_12078 [Pontibacter virosus]